MIKHTRQKFLVALKGIVLCVPLSVLQINYAGWAQTPEALVKNLDDEVNVYVQKLDDPNVTVRVSAASALGRPILGNPIFANPPGSAAMAVSALTKALRDQEATVRVSAAVALGKRSYNPATNEDVKFLAKLAVPELIKTLKDDKEIAGVRARAVNSIGEISQAINQRTHNSLPEFLRNENIIIDLVSPLSTALNDQDVQVRICAAYALGTTGSDSSTVVTALIDLLKNQKKDVIVRAKAAEALGNAETLGNADLKASLNSKAVPALISALQEQKADAYFLRANAALALGSMGSDPKVAKDAVPLLITALKDENTLIRSDAANALGLMRSNATNAIPHLIAVMNKDNEDEQVRIDAVNALEKIASDSKVPNSPRLVSNLIDILNNGSKPPYVREAAAYALGNVGLESEKAIKTLIEVVEDVGNETEVRQYAAYGLVMFFKKQTYQNANKNQEKSLISRVWEQILIIRYGNKASKALEKVNQNQKLHFEEQEKKVKEYTHDFYSQLRMIILDWIIKKPFVLVPIFLFILLPLFWFFIFLLNPLGLLQIKQLSNRFKNLDLPNLLTGGFKVTIDTLLFLSFFDFFCYRARVLDTWISKHYKSFHPKLIEIIKTHDDYTPPILLDKKSIPKLTIEELRPIFSKNITCLVIQGEEGGKLAYKLADWAMLKDKNKRLCKHLMLPVLISDFELKSPNKAEDKPFINAISRQVIDYVEEINSISSELLDQLLRQRRVLVIVIVDVDDSSKMSDEKILELKSQLSEPGFPANALVIISRTQLELKGRLYSLCQITSPK